MKGLWVPTILLALWPLLSLVVPWLPLADFDMTNLSRALQGSSADHLLGTDQSGRDCLSLLLWGARHSLQVALPTVFASALTGLLIGLVAAHFAGKVDLILSSLMDMILAFPGLLLLLTLAALIPSPSLSYLIVALTFVGWPGYARLVRAEAYRIRAKDYLTSAAALGLSPQQQALSHILPNLLTPLVIKMIFGICSVILLESSLSFLGVGLPPDWVSWGQMIGEGRHFLLERPALVLYPSLCLVCVLGLSFWLGEALLDKHKGGH